MPLPATTAVTAETLVVDPAGLRRAAARAEQAAATAATSARAAGATRLTSTDVGADGAELVAAVARYAGRAQRTLEAGAAALRADAARLRRCARDYVTSDTTTAAALRRTAAGLPAAAPEPAP